MHVRQTAILVISVSLAFSLSACGAGNNAPTRMTTQVTDGVDGAITTYGNDIRVSSVLLVAQSDGSAVLIGSIVNENPTEDHLLSVIVGGINVVLSQNSLALKQNEPMRFAGESANASAVAPGLNATPGDRVKVQLYFATAGQLTLDAMVRDRSGIYANVGA
jgi:D-arabinose 1-dehydrogenase-like Zn-dependent alcohol dehydrogenase